MVAIVWCVSARERERRSGGAAQWRGADGVRSGQRDPERRAFRSQHCHRCGYSPV